MYFQQAMVIDMRVMYINMDVLALKDMLISVILISPLSDMHWVYELDDVQDVPTRFY